MHSAHFIQNFIYEQKVKSAPLLLPRPLNCLFRNGDAIQVLRGSPGVPHSREYVLSGEICSHQETRSCLNENNTSTASTEVWSVLCAWHCPSRESAGSGETVHEQQALTASLTTALASPYLSTPLNLTIWSAGNILWLQVNFFSVTPSAGGVKSGSGLPWTPTCSQIPQNHLFFFSNIYSSPFLGSSKLILPPSRVQLHALLQASGSPIYTEPRPSPHHASKCPLLLAFVPLRSPWF